VLLISRAPDISCSQSLPIFFWATLQSSDSLSPESVSTPIFTASCNESSISSRWLPVRPIRSQRQIDQADGVGESVGTGLRTVGDTEERR
jgi:hypothetical protein